MEMRYVLCLVLKVSWVFSESPSTRISFLKKKKKKMRFVLFLVKYRVFSENLKSPEILKFA